MGIKINALRAAEENAPTRTAGAKERARRIELQTVEI